MKIQEYSWLLSHFVHSFLKKRKSSFMECLLHSSLSDPGSHIFMLFSLWLLHCAWNCSVMTIFVCIINFDFIVLYFLIFCFFLQSGLSIDIYWINWAISECTVFWTDYKPYKDRCGFNTVFTSHIILQVDNYNARFSALCLNIPFLCSIQQF